MSSIFSDLNKLNDNESLRESAKILGESIDFKKKPVNESLLDKIKSKHPELFFDKGDIDDLEEDCCEELTESKVLEGTEAEIEEIFNAAPAITSLKYEFDANANGLDIRFLDGNMLAAVKRLEEHGFTVMNKHREFDGVVTIDR